MDKYLFFIIVVIISFSLYKFFVIYNKYKKFSYNDELTGYDVARMLLDKYKLDTIYIVEAKGKFNDHFDYNQNVLRLSSIVYHDSNLYAYVIASFVAMQAVLKKENNSVFMVKKTIEPLYKLILVFSYVLLIGDLLLGGVFLTICLLYNIVFLNINFDIKTNLEEEFIKLKIIKKSNEDELKESLEIIKYYDVVGMFLCIKIVIDHIIEKIKKI